MCVFVRRYHNIRRVGAIIELIVVITMWMSGTKLWCYALSLTLMSLVSVTGKHLVNHGRYTVFWEVWKKLVEMKQNCWFKCEGGQTSANNDSKM